MPWPLSQDYNEAIQTPASSFADPELRGGEPVTNAMGMPIPRSGNFADVYEFNCPATGNKWALKCFTREMPGLRERYTEISKSLGQLRLPFMVEFQYLEQGIRVRGQWFPLLKMRWVEGLLLNEFLRGALDKPATLEALLHVWVRMGQRLRKSGIAHGDLQHGNVMLVPGTAAKLLAIKLIDYDGMFVPSLAHRKPSEVGHPAYQHPQRLRETLYTPDLDRFPLLVIYCAIRALKVGGRGLWERYDNGDNLLFREQDLRSPRDSALFKELIQLKDPEIKMLVDRLSRAVFKPLDQVPLLDELVPPKETSSASLSAKTAAAAAKSAAEQTLPGPIPSPAPTLVLATPAWQNLLRFVPRGVKRAVAPVLFGIVLLLGMVLTGVWLFAGRGGNKEDKGDKEATAAQEPWLTGSDIKEPHGSGNPKSTHNGNRGTGRKTHPKRPPSHPERVKEPRRKPAPPREKTPEFSALPGEKITNSIGMKLVYLPPGRFGMGSSLRDLDKFQRGGKSSEPQEGPQHLVNLSHGFYMGTCEVTQGQYRDVMGKNPSQQQKSPDHPVEKVTWSDAVRFCKKLSEQLEEAKAGRIYRLPTEAEWEYACRADTQGSFSFGEVLSPSQANFKGGKEAGPGKTIKVGSYPANAWGLHDMHGNVYEWCLDGPRNYTPKSVIDPKGPEEEDDGPRVLRGGSYTTPAEACRCAARKVRDTSYRSSHVGFRVLFER